MNKTPTTQSNPSREETGRALERRIGRFQISDDLMKDWRQLLPLFAKIVVIRCEHIYPWVFQYTALSEMFDIVEEAMEAPDYEMIFTAKWNEAKKKSEIHAIEARKITS